MRGKLKTMKSQISLEQFISSRIGYDKNIAELLRKGERDRLKHQQEEARRVSARVRIQDVSAAGPGQGLEKAQR